MGFAVIFVIIIMSKTIFAKGDSCKLPSTGEVGQCRLLTECPSARRDLEAGVYPLTCGFQEGEPIVCCAEGASANEQTVKATPTTIYTTRPATKPISQENLLDGSKVRQGDSCELPSAGALGQCRLLTECPSARRDLEAGIYPVTCGFHQNRPIVCCAEGASATRQTVKATTTAIYTTRPAAKPISQENLQDGAKGGQRRGETCTTPNNEIAKCVPLETCTVLVLAIQQNTTEIRKFAQQSQCGYDSTRLVCCGTASKITLLSRALPNRTVCGLDVPSWFSLRIYNGNQTRPNEFPWMAALEYNYRVSGTIAGIRCGGSVINNRYVLTAAHCIEPPRFELISVLLGDWMLSTNPDCEDIERSICSDPVQKFNIEEKIPHPDYTSNGHALINDIALLRLAEDITYTDYIIPICLPSPGSAIPNSVTRMTVAGWGLTEKGTTSDIKLKVEIPLQSNKACTDKLNRPLTSSQLCAGGEVGKDSCQGDSGGPLMRSHQDSSSPVAQWFLEGIVSWGIACGRDYPAVYTRVSQYVHWIVDTVSVPKIYELK